VDWNREPHSYWKSCVHSVALTLTHTTSGPALTGWAAFSYEMDDNSATLLRAVGRVEGMLSALTTQIATSHVDNANRFAQMEARLGDVESKISRVFGIGAAIVVLISAAGYWLRTLFGH
jgi:hypothetical protein